MTRVEHRQPLVALQTRQAGADNAVKRKIGVRRRVRGAIFHVALAIGVATADRPGRADAQRRFAIAVGEPAIGSAPAVRPQTKIDRKSTRLTPVTNAHIVCRLLLEKKDT